MNENTNGITTYSLVEINESTSILASAEEMANYNKYLKSAKTNLDADVTVDMDTCDDAPYQIVYGLVMYTNAKRKTVHKYINQTTGTAYINIDTNGNLIASAFDDIHTYDSRSSHKNAFPFVALMKTACNINDRPATLFPYYDKTIFENFIERPFFLACCKSVTVDNITRENWSQYVDKSILTEVNKFFTTK